jgi:hypothetical protein
MVASRAVVGLELAEFGIVGFAHVSRPRAPGVEVTTRRRVDRTRGITFEDEPLALAVELRVGDGHRG